MMRVALELPDLAPATRAVSVGVFDGVHRGHVRILNTLAEAKRRENVERSLLISFDPHPLALVRPDDAPRMISTIAERIAELGRHGPDELLILPFTRELASTPFDEFAREVLVKKLGMKHLVAGYDFRMGRGRGGSAEDMVTLGKQSGFTVEVVEPYYLDDEIISSTTIRAAVEAGDMAAASHRLGRPFRLSGRVVKGDGRGRGLGFPTANLEQFPLQKLLPPTGVYRVRVKWEDGSGEGLMNLGLAPTLRGRFLAEIHILDFQDEIYGKCLEVDVLQRFRGEEKFPNIQALCAQIEKDISRLREILDLEDRKNL